MPDVLIVGAGPTGLAAAVELARRGVVPTIIEERSTPSRLSRAVGIQVASMEILKPSGVADAIAEEAVRFKGVMFHDGAKRLNRLPLNFSAGSSLWGLAQDRTEMHLAEALGRYGGEVRYGRALTGLVQDKAGVTAATGSGTERYDYVIGADGVHSAVRQALGYDFPGFDLPQLWSIADVDSADWPDPGWFKGYLLDHGNVAIVAPLESARYRVISSTPDALTALPVRMRTTKVRRSAAFTISVRQVRRYSEGRVFLAGDAAHCHSPVGGRGMNLGIADAADLARRMVEGDLEGYGAARHEAGRHVLEFSERGRKILQNPNPAVRAMVTTVMRLAGAFPPLGKAMLNRLVND